MFHSRSANILGAPPQLLSLSLSHDADLAIARGDLNALLVIHDATLVSWAQKLAIALPTPRPLQLTLYGTSIIPLPILLD